MPSKLVKTLLPVTIQSPDELVWVGEQTIFKNDTEARLTAAGYDAVKSALESKGYYWELATEFYYSLYNTAWDGGDSTVIINGESVVLPTGWSVIFQSQFLNNQVPDPMWVRDSWVDTPVGGDTITIPGHYATVTPDPVVVQDENLGWNASAISANAYQGDFVAQFRFDTANTGSVAGINLLSNALKSSGFEDIPYCIKTSGNQFQVFESGTAKTSAAAFSTADKFTIRRIGGDVIYARNGTDFHTSASPMSNDYLMVLDVSLYEADDIIYDPFMAVASNALDATDFPWSPTYGGSGGSSIATPDSVSGSNGEAVIINSSVYSYVLSESEIVVSRAIEAESDIVVSQTIEAESELVVSRAIEAESEIVVGRLESIEAESVIVVALTETVIAESVIVVDVPARDVVVAESVIVVDVEEDIESVVVDIRQPETPLYGSY